MIFDHIYGDIKTMLRGLIIGHILFFYIKKIQQII